MSRDWFAGYCSALRKPKYRRLSPSAKGCLLHIWMLAGGQDPEAWWRSRDELCELLTLDGFEVCHLDELISLGWLDIEPEGVWVHDWDDWQIAASKAVLNAYEATRKASWRRRKSPPNPLRERLQDKTRQDIGGDMSPDVPKGNGQVPDMSRTSTLPEGDLDALDVYWEVTGGQNGGYRPWGAWSGDKLKGAMTEYSNAAVESALRAVHAADPTKGTILDRALARLAREADRAKMAAVQPRNGKSPEDKAAEEARYQEIRQRLANGEKVT